MMYQLCESQAHRWLYLALTDYLFLGKQTGPRSEVKEWSVACSHGVHLASKCYYRSSILGYIGAIKFPEKYYYSATRWMISYLLEVIEFTFVFYLLLKEAFGNFGTVNISKLPKWCLFLSEVTKFSSPTHLQQKISYKLPQFSDILDMTKLSRLSLHFRFSAFGNFCRVDLLIILTKHKC
jgi:hypothetical protein